MALTPKKVYAILKKYTDNSIAGGGAIKGKNCTITSIVPITGGNRITFQWTLDNGTVQTDTLDVMNGINGTNGRDGVDGQDGADGADGVGIASIDFKEKDADGNNVYTVTYTDSNTDEIVCPIGPKGDDGVGVPDGGTTGQILAKNSNADGDAKWVDPSAASQVQSDWTQDDDTKVDYIKHKPENLVQDANYVHTDNNYSSTDKSILANIADVVPSDASSSDKLAKMSDIPDVSDFITKTVNDLTNYYLASDTYTKTEVNNLVGAISTITFELVNTLPTTDIETNVIYLVPKSVGTGTSNIKDEYINLDGTTAGWEKIGDTDIDLSGYVTTTALNTALADYTTTSNLNTLLGAKQDTITISGKKVQV